MQAPSMPRSQGLSTDLNPLIAAKRRDIVASAANGDALMRMARMNDELIGFLNRRLEQDRTTAAELQACKSAQAAVSLCTQFFEMAMRQYSEELSLLTSIYLEQAGEAMADIPRAAAAMASAPAAATPLTGDDR